MHYKLMYPSDYMGAHDLDGKEHDVVITKIVQEPLTFTGGVQEDKWIAYFKGAKKKLVLNKTNLKATSTHHGVDHDNWIGKTVTLIPSTTRFGGETVECVRVKPSAKSRIKI